MGARLNAGVDDVAVEYAAELFSKNGVNGTSLADVAKSCGISKGTLYYYFPNKEMLVQRCASDCINRIGERIFSWMDAFARDASAEDVCSGLTAKFFSDKDDLKLLTALLQSGSNEARGLIASALNEWHLMLEVGALRLSRPVSERLIKLSDSMLPLLLGFSVTGSDEAAARAALIKLLD